MKLVMYVLVLIALLGYGGYAYRQSVLERRQEAQERARAEAFAIQKEATSKKNATDILQDYVAREERRLLKTIEDTKNTLTEIARDKEVLSAAVRKATEENDKLTEEMRANKSRLYQNASYANAVRILGFLQSEDLNKLALKYCDEDFATLTADYKARVGVALKSQQSHQKRLQQSRDEYYKAVHGVNEDIEKKNEEARRKIQRTNAEIEARFRSLMGKRERLMKRITDLQKIGLSNSRTQNELRHARTDLSRVENQISQERSVLRLSQSQVTHVTATAAESAGRRRITAAQEARAERDNATHAVTKHETELLNLAADYEKQSLGSLRDAIKQRENLLKVVLDDARNKLDYMKGSTANLDFLKASEIEKVRENLAKKIGEKVSGAPITVDKNKQR